MFINNRAPTVCTNVEKSSNKTWNNKQQLMGCIYYSFYQQLILYTISAIFA